MVKQVSNLAKASGVRFAVLAFGFSLILSGCVTTAQQGCDDELKQRHPNYTELERQTLFYGAKGVGCVQQWFLTLDKKDKDDPGTLKIDYKKIKLDKLLAVSQKQAADLEEILDTDPKNATWYKLLEETGKRSYFEQAERAIKFRVARLKLKLNYEEFRKLLGEADGSSESDERRKSYDARIFLPEFDATRDAPFNAKYIEDAKRDGKLVFAGKTVVFDYELFGKKISDPETPLDSSSFVWKEKVEGLEVTTFKVVASNHASSHPRDKQLNYLEATRIAHSFDKDGNIIATERESKPALRAFTSPADSLDIVVLDTDREGELGFGLPDAVMKLSKGIATGKDLYINNQELLSKLFEEKTKDKRKPLPATKPQKFAVVAAGTPVDPWDKSPRVKGWDIPYDYKAEKRDNYHLEVILKPKKPGDDSLTRAIDFIVKVYHSASNPFQPVKGGVVEYYRPLPPFDEKNVLEVKVDYSNKKKLTVERDGQLSVTAVITPGKNLFTDERPVAIDFSDGDTRWRIVDRDKSGTYMYRKEISGSGITNGQGDSAFGSGSAGGGGYYSAP